MQNLLYILIFSIGLIYCLVIADNETFNRHFEDQLTTDLHDDFFIKESDDKKYACIVKCIPIEEPSMVTLPNKKCVQKLRKKILKSSIPVVLNTFTTSTPPTTTNPSSTTTRTTASTPQSTTTIPSTTTTPPTTKTQPTTTTTTSTTPSTTTSTSTTTTTTTTSAPTTTPSATTQLTTTPSTATPPTTTPTTTTPSTTTPSTTTPSTITTEVLTTFQNPSLRFQNGMSKPTPEISDLFNDLTTQRGVSEGIISEMQNHPKIITTESPLITIDSLPPEDEYDYVTECEDDDESTTIPSTILITSNQLTLSRRNFEQTSTETPTSILTTSPPTTITVSLTSTTPQEYEYETICEDEILPTTPSPTRIKCCPDSVCLLMYPESMLCNQSITPASVDLCDKSCQLDTIKNHLRLRVSKLKDMLILYETQKVLCLLRAEKEHRIRLKIFQRHLANDWKNIYQLASQLDGTNDEYWNIIQELIKEEEEEQSIKSTSKNHTLTLPMDLNLNQLDLLEKFLSNLSEYENHEMIIDVIKKINKNIVSEINGSSPINENFNFDTFHNSTVQWNILRNTLLKFNENETFLARVNTSNEIDILLLNLLKLIGANKTNESDERFILENILNEIQMKINKLLQDKISAINSRKSDIKLPPSSSSDKPKSHLHNDQNTEIMVSVDNTNFNLAKNKNNRETDKFYDINHWSDGRQHHINNNNKLLSLDKNGLGIILHRPQTP